MVLTMIGIACGAIIFTAWVTRSSSASQKSILETAPTSKEKTKQILSRILQSQSHLSVKVKNTPASIQLDESPGSRITLSNGLFPSMTSGLNESDVEVFKEPALALLHSLDMPSGNQTQPMMGLKLACQVMTLPCLATVAPKLKEKYNSGKFSEDACLVMEHGLRAGIPIQGRPLIEASCSVQCLGAIEIMLNKWVRQKDGESAELLDCSADMAPLEREIFGPYSFQEPDEPRLLPVDDPSVKQASHVAMLAINNKILAECPAKGLFQVTPFSLVSVGLSSTSLDIYHRQI